MVSKEIKEKIDLVRAEYELVCDKYIELFSEKQGLEYEFWVGDTVGEVAYFPDYWFNFSDIVLDINNYVPEGLITEWQNESLLNYDKGLKINYYSYKNGLRYSYLVEQNEKTENLHKINVNNYRNKLTEIIDEARKTNRIKGKKVNPRYVKLSQQFVDLIPSPIRKHSLLLFDERGKWKYFIWKSLYQEKTGNISEGIKFGFYLDQLESAVTIMNNKVLLGDIGEISSSEIDVIVNTYDFLVQNWYLFMTHYDVAEEQFKKEYIDKVLLSEITKNGEKSKEYVYMSDDVVKKIEYRYDDFSEYLNFEIKEPK